MLDFGPTVKFGGGGTCT